MFVQQTLGVDVAAPPGGTVLDSCPGHVCHFVMVKACSAAGQVASALLDMARPRLSKNSTRVVESGLMQEL